MILKKNYNIFNNENLRIKSKLFFKFIIILLLSSSYFIGIIEDTIVLHTFIPSNFFIFRNNFFLS